MLHRWRQARAAADGADRGHIIGQLLAGAWRSAPPPLAQSQDVLANVFDLMLAGGAGGLLAHRLAKERLPTPQRLALQRARRHALAQLDCRIENLQALIRECYGAAIVPLLVKGWAVARLYAEPSLRPFDDFDLCVAPEGFDKAVAAIAKLTRSEIIHCVDLHSGLADLSDRAWVELWRRSHYVPCGQVPVRVLGAEDQLRHLTLHFWRHLGCRPLWLCDVGAALESLPEGFDWDYLMSGDRARTDRMLCVLALARELLGADVSHPAVVERAQRLPGWLADTVLWRWGAGPILPGLTHYLRRPRELPGAIRYRWLNPMRAVWRLGIDARPSYTLIQLRALLQRPRQVWRRLRRGLGAKPAGCAFAVHEERVL